MKIIEAIFTKHHTWNSFQKWLFILYKQVQLEEYVMIIKLFKNLPRCMINNTITEPIIESHVLCLKKIVIFTSANQHWLVLWEHKGTKHGTFSNKLLTLVWNRNLSKQSSEKEVSFSRIFCVTLLAETTLMHHRVKASLNKGFSEIIGDFLRMRILDQQTHANITYIDI